ncbi:ATP-dependent Clp protease proteolytic subunit [Clostridium sp.]|uniref:ATP-dependent Clp protease proteolytic subunit n=1 Tax=Clostridium sp. TaxID=1506 RepID=UPI0032166FC8
MRNYDYSSKDILEPGVNEDCIKLAELWHEENDENGELVDYELKGIKEVFHYFHELNLVGTAVYVDNEIAVFTIGEVVNEDMAIVHLEKGRKDIRGIYAYINRTFVENYLSEVEYINKRFALPNSEIMIHQPSGGAQGQATDIRIASERVLRNKKRLNSILSANTGKTVEEIDKDTDTDRDNFMSAEEAMVYGLIDKVIEMGK